MSRFSKPRIRSKISPLIRRKSKTTASEDFGVAGKPVNTSHPFYFGFMVTLGALIALTTLQALASASAVFILIIISLFLAAGLNPAVLFFQNRGLKRGAAVGAVMASVLIFVAIFIAIAVPPLLDQGNQLLDNAPQLIKDLNNNAFMNDLNNRYGVIDSLQTKIDSVIQNGEFAVTAFGGVIGVGKAVVSGLVSTITILVLTLYFITSLKEATQIGLKLVPASRRPRVALLVDAIIARVGAFVGSQILIAAMASVFVTVLSLVLGLPSPISIGIIVFICGLIPLIGHFLGCGIVTLIAATQSVAIGIIAFIAYVVYVQIENYVVTPRIMKRSLNLPGAVTIIAALIGTSLLGLVGGLLAVPVAASIILILEEVVFPRAEQN